MADNPLDKYVPKENPLAKYTPQGNPLEKYATQKSSVIDIIKKVGKAAITPLVKIPESDALQFAAQNLPIQMYGGTPIPSMYIPLALRERMGKETLSSLEQMTSPLGIAGSLALIKGSTIKPKIPAEIPQATTLNIPEVPPTVLPPPRVYERPVSGIPEEMRKLLPHAAAYEKSTTGIPNYMEAMVSKRILESAGIKPSQPIVPKIPQEIITEIGNIKKSNLFRNSIVTSEREYLKGQGNIGKAIADNIDQVINNGEIRAGISKADYMKIRKGMTSEELSNFVDASEGRVYPMNDKVRNLVGFWKSKADEIVNEGMSLGMNVKKIKDVKGGFTPEIELLRPRSDYFPHLTIPIDSPSKVIDETINAAVKRGDFKTIESAKKAWSSYVDYIKSGKKGEDILQYFVDSGQVGTKAEAELILNNFIKVARQRRFGNLERSRELNFPFYDTNPDRVLERYFNGAYHRLEEVKTLGLRDEKMNFLINQMRDNGLDYKNAQTAFRRWTGKEPERLAFGVLSPQVSQGMRSVQQVTKLGLSAVANSTQPMNIAMKTNLSSTLKGIQSLVNLEGRDFAVRTGAVLDATIDDAMQGSMGGLSGFSRRFMKGVGFTATEKANRIISANAGREYTNQMTDKLLNNPGNKFARRALVELGLNPETILERGGVTFDETLKAAQKIVNTTQFRSSVLDFPLFFTSPEGKILTQFKTFAFNQTKFLKDAVLLEARKGNLKPIITAVTLMPILGEGVKDIKSILTGRSRNKQGIERIAENMAAVGGLGILTDMYQSASIGKTMDFLAGPTASDIGNMITGIVQASQGKPKQLGREIVKKVPVAGQFLSNVMIPSKRK